MCKTYLPDFAIMTYDEKYLSKKSLYHCLFIYIPAREIRHRG